MSILSEMPRDFERQLRDSISYDRGEAWYEGYDRNGNLRIINEGVGIFLYLADDGTPGREVHSMKDPDVVVAWINEEVIRISVTNRRVMIKSQLQDGQKNARKEFWKNFKGF